MEIITKTEGNKATMEISGWLDTQTAPQLGEALSGLEDSITSLVFDFTNLEYISSAGLRQVIVAYKKMAQKDGFKIINVSDEVYDVFSLTGFDSKIDIQKKSLSIRCRNYTGSILIILGIRLRMKGSWIWLGSEEEKRSSGIVCLMTAKEVWVQGSSSEKFSMKTGLRKAA